MLHALIGTFIVTSIATASAQDPASRPIFRRSVDRVTVSTMVRDRYGRPITDLTRDDFQLLDSGQARQITEFRSEAMSLTVALLVDFSGSMGLADRREASRSIATDLMRWLTPQDRVGLFAFDKRLRELVPFGSDSNAILDGLGSMRPFGVTSLFDAIADTGQMLASTAGTHRAVIVLTDGVDNASKLTPARVSAIASSVDVPVYLVIVSPPLDRAGQAELNDTSLDATEQNRLADLARWTGGQSFVASSPERSRAVTREIVTELRHQYVIVFTPDPRPGWHGIEIKTLRKKDLIVRARSGYIVEGRPDGN